MRKLFQTTVIIGSAQILVILLQIVRAKTVALLIGSEGVGVLGNTLAFMGVLENICFFGFHIALLRYASEKISQEKFKEASKLFSTTFFIHIIFSSAVIIIALSFLQKINISIYQNLNFLDVSVFAILATVFVILKSDFNCLFNAFNEVKLIGKITVLSAIINLGTTVPLILLWGLKGAIFSIFATALITLLVSVYFYKFYKNGYFASRIQIKKSFFSKKQGLKMLKYGGANQVAILINSFSGYLLRVFVTTKLFLEGAGIFNAALGFGSYVLMIQGPLGIYLYPKLSSIYKNGQETKVEVNNVLRFFLIFLSPIIVCIILFSDMVIKLLLTDAFMPVRAILVWILIAKFFEILQSIIALPLFIMEKFKTYLATITIFNAILIILSHILLKNFNLLGLAIAMSIAYTLLFIFWLIASFKVFGFKIKKVNIFLLITALSLLFLSNYFSGYNFVFRIFPLTLTIIWLLIVIRKEEWRVLIGYIKNKLALFYKRI